MTEPLSRWQRHDLAICAVLLAYAAGPRLPDPKTVERLCETFTEEGVHHVADWLERVSTLRLPHLPEAAARHAAAFLRASVTEGEKCFPDPQLDQLLTVAKVLEQMGTPS